MRTVHTRLPAPTGGMLLAKRPTGIVLALVVIVVALLLQALPTVVFEVTRGVSAAMHGEQVVQPITVGGFHRWSGLVSLFGFGFGVLWLWFWLAVKERRRFASLGFTPAGRFTQPAGGLRRGLRGLLIGLVMLTACVLLPVVTGQAQLGWAAPSSTSWLFIVAMLFGFLLQGSAEEILTRGYLTQAVARRWGVVAAISVQAVFFLALHGANPGMTVLPMINLLLFAVFGSLMSLAEGSLWGLCAMHGAWNWAQGNVYGVAVSGNIVSDSVFGYTAQPGSLDLLTGGAFGIEGSLVTTAVFLIGIALMWRAWQKHRAAEAALSQAA